MLKSSLLCVSLNHAASLHGHFFDQPHRSLSCQLLPAEMSKPSPSVLSLSHSYFPALLLRLLKKNLLKLFVRASLDKPAVANVFTKPAFPEKPLGTRALLHAELQMCKWCVVWRWRQLTAGVLSCQYFKLFSVFCVGVYSTKSINMALIICSSKLSAQSSDY